MGVSAEHGAAWAAETSEMAAPTSEALATAADAAVKAARVAGLEQLAATARVADELGVRIAQGTVCRENIRRQRTGLDLAAYHARRAAGVQRGEDAFAAPGAAVERLRADLTAQSADDEATPPVRGYVCVGPTPMTDGTFDLYWIAVDPDEQGRGLGRQLLAAAEGEVRARGGRLVLIETAGHDAYAPTIRFYERSGYTLVSRIADYYRVGEDKLVFEKRL